MDDVEHDNAERRQVHLVPLVLDPRWVRVTDRAQALDVLARGFDVRRRLLCLVPVELLHVHVLVVRMLASRWYVGADIAPPQ